MIYVLDRARPQSPHDADPPPPVDDCWWHSPLHSVPHDGSTPPKCPRCRADERVGIERMAGK